MDSRTSRVAWAVGDRLARHADGSVVRTVELAEYSDAILPKPTPQVIAVADELQRVDALVVASPTYKATYTGLLKVFLDLYSSTSLVGVVAVPVMTAGSARHALAVEVHLRPLLTELGASVPFGGLCLLTDELAELERVLDTWEQRSFGNAGLAEQLAGKRGME
jgi:FMN reductase